MRTPELIGVGIGLIAVVVLVLVVIMMATARLDRTADQMSLIALLSAEAIKASMTGDKARMEYALAALRNMQRPTVRMPPVSGRAPLPRVGARDPR